MSTYLANLNIQLNFYDVYAPVSTVNFVQPPWNTFVQTPALVFASASPTVDVAVSAPSSSLVLLKFNIFIGDTIVNLKAQQNHKFIIVFPPTVTINNCWIRTTTVGLAYSLDSICQSTTNSILLHNFDSANLNVNLTLYLQGKLTNPTFTYTSYLYASNNLLQSNYTTSATFTQIINTILSYPTLTFT